MRGAAGSGIRVPGGRVFAPPGPPVPGVPPTWDPAFGLFGSHTYTNTNLDVNISTNDPYSRISAVSTFLPTVDEWYGEFLALAGGNPDGALFGLIRGDIANVTDNTNTPGGGTMNNSVSYYDLAGAFGTIFFNAGGVTSNQLATNGTGSMVAGDRIGMRRNMSTGKVMWYVIPVATGIAIPVNQILGVETELDIPGWSAGQPFAMAFGPNNVSMNIRLCCTPALLCAAGSAIVAAHSCGVG